jgi:hypothetical protein
MVHHLGMVADCRDIIHGVVQGGSPHSRRVRFQPHFNGTEPDRLTKANRRLTVFQQPTGHPCPIPRSKIAHNDLCPPRENLPMGA